MPPANSTSPARHSSKAQLRCRAHGDMAEWLATSGGSLVITTYTSGKLVLVSSLAGRLRFRTQKFARPMGIALEDNQLALAVRKQILLFQRNPLKSKAFKLRRSFDTGKVDAHDVAFGRRGVYFANTRYNAIARVSPNKRFVISWQPGFIEGVVRGDRCHLNGLAMREHQPTIATAFCATGHQGGWREQDRFTGGVVIDVQQNEIIASGLCMPHSPRWHEGQLWVCNSGHGLLATVDTTSGQCEEVCALPGFTRGLCFTGNRALVGLSKIRPKHILDAPPVRERHPELMAGIALVDLTTGKQTGGLEFLDGGNEVYEVLFLPDTPKLRIVMPMPSASV